MLSFNHRLISLILCFITVSTFAKSMQSIQSWDLQGAIAAKNQRRAWTASINWLQKGPSAYQIRLYGPLGGGTVIIEKKGRRITLKDGPKVIHAKNADLLLKQQTGVRLPVNNLYYWVRGIPAPGYSSQKTYDKNHLLTSFRQSGYLIQYLKFTLQGGQVLPSKVFLQGPGVTVKLVIKTWKI